MRGDRRRARKSATEIDHGDRMASSVQRAREARQQCRRSGVLVGRPRPVDHDPPGGRVEVGRDEVGRERLHGQTERRCGTRRGRDIRRRDPEPRDRTGKAFERNPKADSAHPRRRDAVQLGDESASTSAPPAPARARSASGLAVRRPRSCGVGLDDRDRELVLGLAHDLGTGTRLNSAA